MEINLSLGFPEFTEELSHRSRPSLDAIVAQFRSAHLEPDSPVRAVHHQQAADGVYAEMPAAIDARLRTALEKRGIARLYSHQAEAFERIETGRNVVIVTPTASGKTLCYNLPVWNRLMRDPDARAMYLFPTKALAEDQLHEFERAVEEMGAGIRAFTYDGDTPQDARKAIRQRANVVLTNPDMLHSGILPHHTRWARYFESLRYIVIDELHYYRGVYGSHLANLLRRLRRICEFYHSKPQFICCSATIANPRELAEAVAAEEFDLVERNGAPRGEKFFIFYNPPVVNRQLGIRRSYINETRRVAMEFLERNLQTLIFANSRLATELLVTYLKDAQDRGRIPTETVRGYRGGYLPKERRDIERRLREGQIRAVVATNALELGIDIGSLDAVVMAGYPGTIASSWQRAGRAGRRQGTSAAVLVASSAPLDQYIVEHPDYFFGRSPEHAYVNPDNLEILLAHLKCAAFELPIREGEKFGRHDTAEICAYLEEAGFLHRSSGAWHWTSDSYPADATSLRSVSSDNFVVVDITGEARGDRRCFLHHRAYHSPREGHLSARSAPVSRGTLRLPGTQGVCEAGGLRLLHRRHRLYAGESARGVRLRCFSFGCAPGSWRCAREPADRGVQEDQVLHQRERRSGEAEYARAGDAHHGFLAAFSGGIPGASGRRLLGGREAERDRRTRHRAAHRGFVADDVRSAGPGRGIERTGCRQPGSFRT